MIRSGRHAILVTTRTATPVVWVFAGLLSMAVAGWPVPVLAEELAKQDQEEEERKPEEKKEAAKPAPPAAAPKPRTGAPPAVSAAPPPTLRFTDDDLDKYRRPAPMEELEEEPDAAPVASAPAKPVAASVQDPNAPRRLLTKPKPRPAPPPPDPLKAFKERESMEKFRTEQVAALREKVRQLEGRLGYLQGKRQALASGLYPPLPPPQSEEDRAKDANLKIGELLADIDAEIKSLDAELGPAREDLVAAELRFGSGAAIP